MDSQQYSLLALPADILHHEILSVPELAGVGPILRMVCIDFAAVIPRELIDWLDFMEYLGANYESLKEDLLLNDLAMKAMFEYKEEESRDYYFAKCGCWCRFYIGTIAAGKCETGKVIRKMTDKIAMNCYRIPRIIIPASIAWANYVHRNHTYGFQNGRAFMRFTDAVIYAAVYYGNLEVLSMFLTIPERFNEHLLFLAAKLGHLDIVFWGSSCIKSFECMDKLAKILITSGAINSTEWKAVRPHHCLEFCILYVCTLVKRSIASRI